jgi:hypothetical protein
MGYIYSHKKWHFPNYCLRDWLRSIEYEFFDMVNRLKGSIGINYKYDPLQVNNTSMLLKLKYHFVKSIIFLAFNSVLQSECIFLNKSLDSLYHTYCSSETDFDTVFYIVC